MKQSKVTSENYANLARTTESADMNMIMQRLQNPETVRLLHAAMGLATESGEFVDQLKKHIFYGKPIDIINIKEETGDVMWYIAVAINVLQTTLDDIMEGNIEKLQKRYPTKFTEDAALNRNIEHELSHFNK
jgi:NTP pyrophosphatase (non-canonical NTP hydrolase)